MVIDRWLIAVNFEQRCSKSRTDPQNANATLDGNLHDLCAITEQMQRDLPAATTPALTSLQAARVAQKYCEDRLQTFTETSSTRPELCLAWSRQGVVRAALRDAAILGAQTTAQGNTQRGLYTHNSFINQPCELLPKKREQQPL